MSQYQGDWGSKGMISRNMKSPKMPTSKFERKASELINAYTEGDFYRAPQVNKKSGKVSSMEKRPTGVLPPIKVRK